MYYHVIIESKSLDVGEQYLYDKEDLEQIKNEFAIPYKSNKPVIINGYSLENKDIIRFCIKESERTIKDIRTEKQEQSYRKTAVALRTKKLVLTDDTLFKDITNAVLNSVTVSHTTANADNLCVKDKVFIVHGHDNEMKLEVARFLEKLNINPVILHEQVNAGKTVIEKIEKFSEVGYAIVLYSPCDIGKENIKKMKLQPRARQNVVFEHGYLLGKLGRDKVSSLVKPNIEKPSDTDGVVYIEYTGNWNILMATELQNAGFNVDLNLLKGR